MVGALLSPLAWAAARLRRDRLFHARGVVYGARVESLVPGTGHPEGVLARRLAGPALVRFSSTWWRAGEWPDLLGVALRFGTSRDEAVRQDLVLVTVRRPWTFPWALVTTRWADFLGNDYYAVTRYEAAGLGHVEVRACAERAPGPRRGTTRSARLAEDASARGASLRIELRKLGAPTWLPIARVRIRDARPDADAVRFDPFRTGAGLVPRGFVHQARRAIYAASRLAVRSPAKARGAAYSPRA